MPLNPKPGYYMKLKFQCTALGAGINAGDTAVTLTPVSPTDLSSPENISKGTINNGAAIVLNITDPNFAAFYVLGYYYYMTVERGQQGPGFQPVVSEHTPFSS